MRKPYKECNACERWLESNIRSDGKRTAREYWISIDHSLSGPAVVYYEEMPHTVHVIEVEDDSFEDLTK